MTKNCEFDKYKYCGYGIGYDRKGFFSQHCWGTGRNVIISGVDISSTTKIDNRKKDNLILSKGHTQGLEHAVSIKIVFD